MTGLEITLLCLLIFAIWLVVSIVYTIDGSLRPSSREKWKTIVYTWPLLTIVGGLKLLIDLFERKK